jgi:hypothetical protein
MLIGRRGGGRVAMGCSSSGRKEERKQGLGVAGAAARALLLLLVLDGRRVSVKTIPNRRLRPSPRSHTSYL